MGTFPDIHFGICPECGGKGASVSSPSSADASARTTAGEDGYDPGNGIELIKYDGRYICEMCKNRLIADEESLKGAKRQAEEERFRSQVEFSNSV